MEQSHFEKANIHSSTQEILQLLWDPNVYYCPYKIRQITGCV